MARIGRANGRMATDYRRLRRKVRTWRAGSSRQMAKRWPRSFGGWTYAIVGDLALTAWLATMIFVKPNDAIRLVLSTVILPVVLLAPPYTAFLWWHYTRTQQRYRKKATARPEELVQTAGSVHGEVVGRDQLCQTLMADLRSPDRQPHILVGGVGTGKTAVLVELTRQLAKRRAIPVNIRLRDAQVGLDFFEMARKRLLADLNAGLGTAGDGDRIWRRLLRDGKIVVLADGLEEALLGRDTASRDRDSIIRLAIRAAGEQNLPLVIASRPHDPLRAVGAAITQLEPLGEGPALEYVQDGAAAYDHTHLAKMIQDANVANAPLYLQMIRQLYRNAPWKWQQLSKDRESGRLDRSDRTTDQAWLRLRLFEYWREALEEGYLYEDYALKTGLRIRTVEHLSAMACVGLIKDQLEVTFDDLGEAADGDGRSATPNETRPGEHFDQAALRTRVQESVTARLSHHGDVRQATSAGWSDQLRIAAVMGDELGIVEARQHSVRFKHSLMQAYLGSRYISCALEHEGYRSEALKKPSRELLVAMVFDSRSEQAHRDRRRARSRAKASPAGAHAAELRERAKVVQDCNGPLALDMYATALEIVSAPRGVDADIAERTPRMDQRRGGRGGRLPGDLVASMAGEIADRWANLHTADAFERTVEGAKLRMIYRLGRSARSVADGYDNASPVHGLYRSLYDISCDEQDYAIRLAAVQEIGDGGDQAFHELGPDLLAGSHVNRIPHVDWATRTRQAVEDVDKPWRMNIVGAWLAPYLYHSTSAAGRPGSRGYEKDAFDNLTTWVRGLARFNPADPVARPSISAEIALAQGFRHVANRCSDADAHAGGAADVQEKRKRTALMASAEEALSRSQFWYSQLVLIQALALWSLPDDPSEGVPTSGHGSDARGAVRHWLDIAGSRRPDSARNDGGQRHPFVTEAGELAVLAMESRNPASYCWIDESSVLGQVGSSSVRPTGRRNAHRLWILPSTGWTALVPRAQRLAADVQMLLNLAQRGDDPTKRDDYLERANRTDLPPCMTKARDQLDVTRKIGSARTAAPGTNCIDDCAFHLCPYPPVGELFYRSELSEGLCRRLAVEANRGKAWQRKLSRPQLKSFWTQMSKRGRPRANASDRS